MGYVDGDGEEARTMLVSGNVRIRFECGGAHHKHAAN